MYVCIYIFSTVKKHSLVLLKHSHDILSQSAKEQLQKTAVDVLLSSACSSSSSSSSDESSSAPLSSVADGVAADVSESGFSNDKQESYNGSTKSSS